MQRIRSIATVRDRISERADHLEGTPRRSRPSVREDDRQGVGLGDLTWRKWMPARSIFVRNCGKSFSAASHTLQS